MATEPQAAEVRAGEAIGPPPGHIAVSLRMSDGPPNVFIRADAIMAITPVDESVTQTELWIGPKQAWVANATVEEVGLAVAAALAPPVAAALASSGPSGEGVTREELDAAQAGLHEMYLAADDYSEAEPHRDAVRLVLDKLESSRG